MPVARRPGRDEACTTGLAPPPTGPGVEEETEAQHERKPKQQQLLEQRQTQQ